ncbi:MAG: ABC transporter ATP-binding protein [Candidatus Aenigmarchaeota archaeon]|nr:ABC transporter ATP-binding protein [Candidatus Aenigmarchaeota archaeon]
MSALLELEHVSKIYKLDEVEVKALDDVNLKIEKNEFLAVTGPSGSGKSTLLHIMGCLDRPTRGRVILEGRDVSSLSDAELARIRGMKIGFIFQFFNLYPTLTALENVELPMIIVEKDKKERKKRALELLKSVGMEKRASHLPSQLSGGERQRVAIARALANNPSIILADEPTGNLDSKTGKEIINLLAKLQKEEGKTVVIVTHEPTIAKYAERIIYLTDGKIIRGGS